MGLLRFGLWYLFSPKFRFQEELEANKVQMHYLKEHDLNHNVQRRAYVLSS